jgi:hypothetical protein
MILGAERLSAESGVRSADVYLPTQNSTCVFIAAHLLMVRCSPDFTMPKMWLKNKEMNRIRR